MVSITTKTHKPTNFDRKSNSLFTVIGIDEIRDKSSQVTL